MSGLDDEEYARDLAAEEEALYEAEMQARFDEEAEEQAARAGTPSRLPMYSGERAGTPRTCGSCCHWSEMLARSIGGGPVEAMCLAPRDSGGAHRQQYTTERQTCDAWEAGDALDSPGAE